MELSDQRPESSFYVDELSVMQIKMALRMSLFRTRVYLTWSLYTHILENSMI